MHEIVLKCMHCSLFLGTDGKFTIDSISGVITTTAERLDYENRTTYALNVTATDTGGLQVYMTTSI